MQDEPESICTACKTVFIDLMNLASRSQDPVWHSITFAQVGQSATSCVVCAFLLGAEDEDDLFDEQSDPGTTDYGSAFFTFQPIWHDLDKTCTAVTHGFDELEIHLQSEDGTNVARHGRTHLLRNEVGFPVETMNGRVQHLSEDLSMAKTWIQHCATSHSMCPGDVAKPMPTRVIEISQADGPKLRLISGNSYVGRYTALSHCWGKIKPTVVTHSHNVEEHHRSIDYLRLPTNFRDAVKVTIALGYNYLWIDSICIVQDDPRDWERECVRMGDVYANAAVTISASKASDSTAGFLANRQPLLKQSCQMKIPLTFTNAALNLALVRKQNGTRFEFINDPLMTRGWVMQERLLTPRILHFSKAQMVFECAQGENHEDQWFSIVPEQSNLFVPKSFLNIDNKNLLFDRWYTILESYTWMYLTYGSDRLPALSGLASSFSRKTGSTYMAGLWREDLKGLVWVSANNLEEWKYVRRNRDEMAPSWTWSSCETPVGFAFRNHWLEQGLWSDDASIQAVRTQSLGTDPLGRLKTGVLTIRGYVQTIEVLGRQERFEEHVRRRNGTFRNDSEEAFAYKGLLLPGAFGVFINLPLGNNHCAMSFYPDNNDEWQAEACRKLIILLIGTLAKPNSADVEGWVGLGLQPIGVAQNGYRRLGIVTNTSGLPGKGYEDIVGAAVSLEWIRSGAKCDVDIS